MILVLKNSIVRDPKLIFGARAKLKEDDLEEFLDIYVKIKPKANNSSVTAVLGTVIGN